MGRAGCAGLVLGARARPPAGGAHRYTGAARPTCTLRVPLARAGTPLKTPASWSWHSRPPFFEVFPRFRLGQATGGSERAARILYTHASSLFCEVLLATNEPRETVVCVPPACAWPELVSARGFACASQRELLTRVCAPRRATARALSAQDLLWVVSEPVPTSWRDMGPT